MSAPLRRSDAVDVFLYLVMYPVMVCVWSDCMLVLNRFSYAMSPMLAFISGLPSRATTARFRNPARARQCPSAVVHHAQFCRQVADATLVIDLKQSGPH